MSPHRFCWSFAYDAPLAQIIAIVLVLGMILTKEKLSLPRHPLILIWVLFIIWMNVTALFALNPQGAFHEWDRAMKIQLVTFFTLALINTRQRIETLTWVIAGSIAIFGVKGGLFALRTGMEWKVLGPPGSFIAGNNEIGFALLIVLPLVRFIQLRIQKRIYKHALSVVMALSLISVITTYSRGAILALGVASLYLVWKSRQRVALLFMLVLLTPVIFSMLPEKWFDRMYSIQTYEEDASAMGRINSWWFAYNLAKDRPIVGGGLNAFTPELFIRYAPNPEDFHDAHSIYFEVLAEMGFVGLFLFVTLFLSAHFIAGRTGRRARASPELSWAVDLCAMLQVALVCYGAGGAFLGLAYFDLPYHLVALVLLTQQYVDRELAVAKAAGNSAMQVGVGQR